MKMKSRRMDEAEPGHFSSEDHALAAGMLLGQLHKAMTEDEGLGITLVRPFMDGDGNYTNQMLVQINGRAYTVTIDEAVEEAMME